MPNPLSPAPLGVVLFFLLAPGVVLSAEPIDCAGPAGDPAPGTAAFALRDATNMACTEQRHTDSFRHPNSLRWSQGYGADPYRAPARHDGVRFRHRDLVIAGAEAEVYLPCTDGTCPALPQDLERHKPPYPVAIILHGLASDKDHLWWASQPLAERGYFVIAVNGTGAALPGDILDWIESSGPDLFPGEMDTDRIGIAGHSLGAENSTRTQGDPRISAIIAWDPCDSPFGCVNSDGSRLHDRGAAARTPTLFIAADYSGFPGYAQPRTSVPGTLRVAGYEILRRNGVDSLLITPRATTHLDWAGSFTFGSRYGESISSYFNLAWFDRYVKGKLVLDTSGNVVATHGRDAAQERSFRQSWALSGYRRLIAQTVDDSADRHNISQGTWDSVQAAARGDFEYGGNRPYSIAGHPVADRLSFYHRSVCFLSLPDLLGGDGAPGAPLHARADSTANGDMRLRGCPEQQFGADGDLDTVVDFLDNCPATPNPDQSDGDGDGLGDACDPDPDAFAFAAVGVLSGNRLVESEEVRITGLNSPAPVAVSNGQWRHRSGKRWSDWTTHPGSVSDRDWVQLRHWSADEPTASRETTIVIGGASAVFRSTTQAALGEALPVQAPSQTPPDPFRFTDLTDVARGQWIESDAVLLSGIQTQAICRTHGSGQLSVNDGAFAIGAQPCTDGDSVRVRHLSADRRGLTVDTILDVAGAWDTFSSTTR